MSDIKWIDYDDLYRIPSGSPAVRIADWQKATEQEVYVSGVIDLADDDVEHLKKRFSWGGEWWQFSLSGDEKKAFWQHIGFDTKEQ